MVRPMKPRLTKPDWIAHGLRTLATDGPSALKIVPMSAKLKVSSGSFYWHFRDIADFRSQILRGWQERTTDRVIEELEAQAAGPGRLKQLLRRGFDGRPRLDRAMRSWAAEDRAVAVIVAAVDARRVAYIADLLAAAGVESRKALPRATFLYWAYLGQAMVMDPRHSSIDASTLDDISGLFEQ